MLAIGLDLLTPPERRDLANALLRAAWSATLAHTRILLLDLLLEVDEHPDWGYPVSQRDSDATEDRLIFLAEALTLVPFSETTLRRAIARGELEAWRPNRDGKLVMWCGTLIDWATRRPATDKRQPDTRNERRPTRSSSRRARRRADISRTPDPITLPDVA
jgi:hypothetical protein